MVGPRHRGGYGRPFRRPGGTVPASADERALSALDGEHAASVRAFVRTFTSDAGQVEDVVQETFLRVWRHIDGVRTEESPRSYLFTTARNVLTDQWRARQRRPDLVNDELRLAREPAQDAVDTALQALTVNEALSRLSRDHQDVIQALYYDGLTVPEAAERLGIVPGTVKSRGYYAVRSLRAACDEMGLTR